MGEAIDGTLQEDAGDQAIDPAIEVAGDVLQGLADADRAFEEDRSAAHLLHGKFEGELGAKRGLFEEHADVFSLEGMRVVGGRGLHFGGEVEQVEEFVVREVEILEEVGGGGFQDLVRSKHGGHGERLD